MARLQGIRRTTRVERQDILQLKSDYQMWHARRIAQHREDEKYYHLQFNVPSPGGRDPLIVPTAHQIPEELINHLIAEIPVISVLSRSMDDRAQRQAGKITKWVNAFWRARGLLIQLMRGFLWASSVRGVHVVRLLYDPGEWPMKPIPPEEPAEPSDLVNTTEDEMLAYMDSLVQYADDHDRYLEDLEEWREYTTEHTPIKIRAVDPLYCFWEPTPDPKRMIICWDRPAADILEQHPDAYDYFKDFDTPKDTTKVQWCEYWDEEVFAYWVEPHGSKVRNGEPFWVQEPYPHNYGFFPFVIDGPWRTPLDDPEKQFQSIYGPIKAVLQYESTLITQVAHLIRANGWSPLIIKSERAASDEQRPVIDMEPGQQNYLMPDEDVRYLEYSGQTMASLTNLINFVDQYIQEGSGIADILRGQTKGRSGYQQAQAAAMARVALVPVEHCTIRTLQAVTAGVLKLVKVVNDRVSVLGDYASADNELTIGPKDVVSHGPIVVQMKTVLPIDEGAKIGNYMQMNKAGWLSGIEAARRSGIENPEEQHDRWEAEEIENSPEVRHIKAIEYIKENWPDLVPFVEQAEQLDKAKAQQGPKLPGGTGAPRPPAAPGSQREAMQARKQGRQGGMPPKRLHAKPPLEDISSGVL